MKDYVCIYEGDNLVETELVKSKLEAAGIPYLVKSNDASGTMPHLKLEKGTQILISEEHKDRALKQLKEEHI
ncbi:MAG: DUF2007 domain-containing protein [Chlamydiia bacterium]|nr:DUF2007 domain-containing protein [Chlamydiia bacterium]MCB9092848.1 DUF2007 domain-containing protein [Halobacteriovoraceae bacterium]